MRTMTTEFVGLAAQLIDTQLFMIKSKPRHCGFVGVELDATRHWTDANRRRIAHILRGLLF